MRVPQVNERVKEAPATGLRAMFSAIGQFLSVTDKLRGKSATAGKGSVDPETMVPDTVAPEAAAPAAPAKPKAAAKPRPAAKPKAAKPATVTPEAAGGHVRLLTPDEAPAAAAKPAAAPAPVPAAEPAPPTLPMPAAAELPLANYDELSVASLRARLRNLSADQLGQLIEYEKGHAGRADVITMFERRIVKIADES
jgi:hypothetical protein